MAKVMSSGDKVFMRRIKQFFSNAMLKYKNNEFLEYLVGRFPHYLTVRIVVNIMQYLRYREDGGVTILRSLKYFLDNTTGGKMVKKDDKRKKVLIGSIISICSNNIPYVLNYIIKTFSVQIDEVFDTLFKVCMENRDNLLILLVNFDLTKDEIIDYILYAFDKIINNRPYPHNYELKLLADQLNDKQIIDILYDILDILEDSDNDSKNYQNMPLCLRMKKLLDRRIIPKSVIEEFKPFMSESEYAGFFKSIDGDWVQLRL